MAMEFQGQPYMGDVMTGLNRRLQHHVDAAVTRDNRDSITAYLCERPALMLTMLDLAERYALDTGKTTTADRNDRH